MRARSKKILSLLLAASMVFAMNSFAFAAEAAETFEPAFETQEVKLHLKDYFNEKDAVVSYVANKKGTATDLAVITNVDDPKNWISANKPSDTSKLVSTILYGRHLDDEHLANQEKVTVSRDTTSSSVVSSDIIPLDEAGHYLLIGYYGGKGAYVEGFEDKIPVVTYTGRTVYWHKANKSSKSKVATLRVGAALVSYNAAAATVTELEGVTVKSVKVKNNKAASVSGEAVEDPKYPDDEVYKLLPGAVLPTFTVKVAAKDDAKPFKKTITTELKNKIYTFAIKQAVIELEPYAGWEIGMYDDPQNTVKPDKIKDNENYLVGETGAGMLTVNDTTLYAAKVKGTKANLTYGISFTTKKGSKSATIKLKPGKDYTLTTKTVGGETVTVMSEALGNYMFSTKDGLTAEGFLPAFRTYGEKKAAHTRYGFYKADDNAFVYSED